MSKRVAAALAVNCYLLLILCAGAQDLAAQSSRIAAAVNRRATVALAGHVHPLATAANDRGLVDASMPMPGMTLFFRPSASQQQALEALLTRQQDPSSPDYHNWLTPEQYADRFGLSPADMAKVTTWLEGEGFSIALTARGRNSISFNGTASQVEKTFQTQIHHYFVNGKMHYANATDPFIPAALNGIVGSIRGLHDFHPEAHPNLRKPRYTNTPAQGGGYQIAPDDAAVIYDYKTLYGQGIDGTGQKVVVVGQVQINLTDIATFRSDFNLPATAPTLVPVPNLPAAPSGASDSGDLGESDLDLETVGGVARGATVVFVYSQNVEDAITYTIDQDLAPVLSSSYGLCEVLATQAGTLSDQVMAQQANAEGITWLSAAGDDGAVDCFGQVKGNPGLGVDEPGSIPEVTSVGGTELNEGTGNYWASTNNANGASALSYIPETAWNDTAQDDTPSAGGGGASLFFSRPTWQTGAGTFDTAGMRDVPDVSFASSADHDGWLIYTAGQMYVYGGTSVAAPLFAGMLTLLNHYQVANGLVTKPGLGNVNPKLYSLAAASPGSFHDVTTGNNAVDPCTGRSSGCNQALGYNAGPGFDMATGLGSLDAYSFISAWNGTAVSTKTTPVISLSATPQTLSPSGSTILTATVSGSTTPTGSVTWTIGSVSLGSATLVASSAGTATATLTVQGYQLSSGANTVAATYGGDANFNTGSQTLTLTVNSKQTPVISLSATQSTIQASGSTVLTATVSGSTTPSGFVAWTIGSVNLGSATLTGSGGKATASLTVYGYQLSAGANTLTAEYVGDSNFNPGSLTQTITLATSQTPNITSNAAVVSSASFQAGVTANSWVTITGTNLSTVTDTWSNSIVNGALPITLDGVSVTIGGLRAYIYYVSPTQINVLAPGIGTGQVQVVVTNVNGASAPVTATAQPLQPAFFQWGSYAVATRPDYTFAVKAGTFSGITTTPAKPGDTIILWGTGFGATSPAAPAGFVTPTGTIYYTASTVTVTLGTITISATAALTPGAAGLYQVAFQVPALMANGDYPVVATINGLQSPATTLLTIQN